MAIASWIRVLATAIVIAAQIGLADAAPEVGWWWNPDESGRGYFIESQDGIFFMAAYFYADDGRARWLIAGGANSDPYNFSGRLSEVSNGQTLYGPYVPPTTLVDAGAVSVSFSDDIHGTIVWPGGTIPIIRDIFDAGTPASFQPVFYRTLAGCGRLTLRTSVQHVAKMHHSVTQENDKKPHAMCDAASRGAEVGHERGYLP